MSNGNVDKDIRLVVCGAEGAGKSTLLRCFCIESRTGGGEGEGDTVLILDDVNIRIHVAERTKWNREFSSEFDAAAVVFATDDVDSFEYCIDLISEIRSGMRIPIVVIENKMDLLEQTALQKEDVERKMRELRLRLYRVSALEEFNVMHPFAYLLEKLTRNIDENRNECGKPSLVHQIRLPSREGWKEETQRKKEKCTIM